MGNLVKWLFYVWLFTMLFMMVVVCPPLGILFILLFMLIRYI